MRNRFGRVFVRKNRKGYYVRFRYQGQEVERFGGLTKAAAAKKLSKAHAMLADGATVEQVLADVFGAISGERLSFKDALPHYLSYAEKRKKASTLHRDIQRLARVQRESWAKELLPRIRPEQLTRFAQRRRAEGASAPTVNRDLAIISAVFKWAVSMGFVDENPTRRVQRFNERGRERRVYLTGPEARALIAASDDALRPLVLCALHTGMRRGELLALRWRSVDFERGCLTVEPATEKTGRGRVIPMTDELAGTLAALRQARPVRRLDRQDHVFTRADGKPWGPATARKMFLKAVLCCSSIPEDKRDEVTFHTLRHTAATLMVSKGVPLFDVAKILGHSSLSMTMRYAHFAPDAGRVAIGQLAVALRAQR
jgi:integrase